MPNSSSALYTGLVGEAILERDEAVLEKNEREDRTASSRGVLFLQNKELVQNIILSQLNNIRMNIRNRFEGLEDNGSAHHQYAHKGEVTNHVQNSNHITVEGGTNISGRP